MGKRTSLDFGSTRCYTIRASKGFRKRDNEEVQTLMLVLPASVKSHNNSKYKYSQKVRPFWAKQ